MELNLMGPINQLGYGVVGYNVLKTLDRLGHDVAYFPIGSPSWSGDSGLNALLKKTTERSQLFPVNAPCVKIWHQFGLDQFVGGGTRLGWPIFELNRFNKKEHHHLSSVDGLIVCSQWAKDVIRENGINVPTFVAPLGVDENTFKVDESAKAMRPSWCKNTTVFINVGKWEKRKGHEELLIAFSEAFNPGDDVELWMINDNPFIGSENDSWKKAYASSKMGAHIKFFPRFDMHQHLNTVFNQVDCGIFPSHAEGWNLEIPELLACGAHIIATNYSGHTEYLNNDNAFLIEPNGMELAQDGKWFHGQGEWCSFSVSDLINKLKEVHELKQSGRLGINEAGVETAKKFTWESTVKKLLGAVSVSNRDYVRKFNVGAGT